MIRIGLMIALGACGGTAKSSAPGPRAIALEPTVATQAWYRAASICGQGPYEVEVPVANARWGEEFELRVATPRRIQVHAVVVADDAEVAKTAAVFGATGRVEGKVENTRCVADVRERLAASRGGSGSTSSEPPGNPGTPSTTVKPPPDGTPATTISVTGQLQIDDGLVPASVEVVRFGWRQREQDRAARIRIRFWSIEPNDLEGVRFGVSRIEWRPNVSEADYAAHLTRLAADEEAARLRREETWRREQEAERQRQRERPAVRAVVSVHDAKAELELYRKREAERRQREIAIALEADRARRAIALEADRARRRKEFCARHPEDRDCWGAGGMQVYLALEQHGREREQYCLANGEDARCWTAAERTRRELVWRKRIQVATAPPQTPEGPPPAALAETVPPKLSLHAEWRPGYWQWTGTTWAWLAGMWRVPESDIVAEQTTTAPAAPPALQVEARPAAPMRATIWVTGFWQWNGTGWVWVAGSWQAQPEAGTSWRPAQWKARGAVHILIPGGWVRVQGGR